MFSEHASLSFLRLSRRERGWSRRFPDGRGPLVSPRAADGCIAPMIRKPVRATADVTGRTTASVGHRTAASRGETNGRTAPTQAVPWHERFHHSGVVLPAMPMPRTHASRHTTRTTGSSRPCDRRPARDRVGDPRCCSRWGCNSGPERKPAYEAIVGAGRQPSLLSGISERQLPVDGAVRMPRLR